MKRLITLCLVLLGMTLSFGVIGLIVLFATGTVSTVEEVSHLLSGRKAGEALPVTFSPAAHIVDAVQTFQEHKDEVAQDLSLLQQSASDLQLEKDNLMADLKVLQAEQRQEGAADSEQRAGRLAATVALFNGMRPADAAVIMDNLNDGLTLELLTAMDERLAARVLTDLGNDPRKAALIEKFLQIKK
jgi:flagellar motility protein MotE (MotC chaperone)